MSDNRGKRKNYFVVLNNTERSMCANAIAAIEGGLHPLMRNIEDLFKSKRIVHTILEETRGFRIVVPQDDLWLLSHILNWYGSFSPIKKKEILESESSSQKYRMLGIHLDFRNRYMDSFDFDPKFLIDGEHANVSPFNISHTRLLLVRRSDKLVDLLKEMIQFSDESDSDYQLRINNVVKNGICCKGDQVAELVNFTDLMKKFTITSDSGYLS